MRTFMPGVARCLLFLMLASLGGAEPPAPGPVRFQRVHVPADRVEQWPLAGERYLPIPASEFERLVKMAESSDQPDMPRVARSEYRASLAADGLLEGTASLDIETPSGKAAWLSLGTGRMAVETAHWQDPRKTTTLGLTDRGEVRVHVEERGRLEFAWTLAGSRGPGNVRRFDLRLAPSMDSTLVLDLPDDATPACDQGICVLSSSGTANRKTWRFKLGGRRDATLRIARADVSAPSESRPDVHESLVYGFTESGVEVQADLRIEASGYTPRRVSVLIDPELKLVTAQYGQTPVSWSVSAVPGGQFSRVVVDLPETLQPSARELHLAAMCPLIVDRSWRLPRIRPEGMFWREASATLMASPPLCLARLNPIEGRQSRLGTVGTFAKGEKAEFQYYSPESTVEVVVSRPRVPIEIDYGLSIELDATEATAEWVGLFKANEREWFDLEANLDASWIVDSVHCAAPALIRDWNQSAAPDGGSRLKIRLAKAMKSGQSAQKITIMGRRLQSPLGRELTVDDLTPVRFAEARTQTRLVDIRARLPYELIVRGDERLRRVSDDNTDEQARALLPAELGSWAFFHDEAADDLRLELARARLGFACDIETVARVSRESMLETHRFHCIPSSSQMDHVLVHFSIPRDAPPRWSLGASENHPLSARRLTAAERAAAGINPDAQGETWDIPLVPPRSDSFVIHAIRSTALRGKTPISLAAMPEADRQAGRLLIRAEQDAPLAIDRGRLESISPEPPPRGQYQTARATFRYWPESLAQPGSNDVVAVAVDNGSEHSCSAFAWNCRIDSRFAPGGGAQHLVTYRIESAGCPRFRVSWPSSSPERRIHEVRTDGQTTIWRDAGMPGRRSLEIDLPPAKRFVVVEIDFAEQTPALGFVDSLRSPAMESDIRVLATRWIAQVPASHRVLDDGDLREEHSAGWLARWFGPLARQSGGAPFDPLAGDAGRSRPDEGPWTPARMLLASSDDAAEWNARSLELSPAQPGRLRIVRAGGIEAVRWFAFLLAVGVGMWLLAHRARPIALAAAVCALLAALLPTVPAAAASGVFLGMLFCLFAWLIRRRPDDNAHESNDLTHGSGFSLHPSLSSGATMLPVVLAVMFALSCGGELSASETRGAKTVHRVLIPVDARRKPSGENVFVPESLYHELTTRSSPGRRSHENWVIERATYQGELVWEGTPRQLTPGAMRACFFIRVFGPSTRVCLPLSREQLSIGSEWAFLDGHAFHPEWEPDGRAMRFVVPAEGYYRLELAFTPVMRSANRTASRKSPPDACGFNVSIPPVPNSRLEFVLPAGSPVVEIPSAQGRVAHAKQLLSGQLGGTDRLSVRWQTGSGPRMADAVVEADELLWLNVTPSSVLVDARFQIRVLEGKVSEIRLAADPRLTLLGDPSVGRAEAVPGSPGSLRVILPSAQSDAFTLAARFTLEDTSGVGRHRLPRLTVEGARITRRWFAVSVDPSLQWTEHLPADHLPEVSGGNGRCRGVLESMAIPDFLAAWGDAEATAWKAYRHRDAEPLWSMSTRPRPGRTIVDQRLTAIFAERRVELWHEATIESSPGYGFRYRLHVDPSVEVESIDAREDGVDRLARWNRAEDGSIDVVLAGPASARRHLTLRGHAPVPKEGSFELPLPRIEDAALRSFHVTLLRQSPVLLELEQYEGLDEAEPEALTRDQLAHSRLFVSLIKSGPKRPRLRLHVAPNPSIIDVRQTMSIESSRPGHWVARIGLDVEPREGIGDEIRLVVPEDLVEPSKIEPYALLSRAASGDGRKTWILRGLRPIADRQQWSLTVPLEPDQVVVPEVTVANARNEERRLVLPRRVDGRAARWTTRQLKKIASTDDAITYKIVGKDYRAALVPSERAGLTAGVCLADVRAAWSEDGTCRGTVTFDLETSGRSSCPLTVPEDCHIVQLTVDGVPTTVDFSKTDPANGKTLRRGRIPLGLRTLPREIAVVFTGRLRAGPGRWRFAFDVPRLGNLPVEKSIWTVSGPAEYESAGHCEAWPSSLGVIRAERLNVMLEATAKSEASADDRLRWARAWQSRAAQVRAALESVVEGPKTSPAREPSDQALRSLDRQWTRLCEALGDPSLLDLGAGLVETRPGNDDPIEGSIHANHSHAVRRVVAAGMDSLTFENRRPPCSWAVERLPAALAIVLLALLGYLADLCGAWGVLVRCWPAGPVIGAGLAWWLLLTPSLVGLLVAGAGVWWTVVSIRRRFQPENSSVVLIKKQTP
ncbi:MAG: hypothetical protein JW719_02610 [Pirellulales bacterium]|nr:hypothetical protein [Pirellulales bacterium]